MKNEGAMVKALKMIAEHDICPLPYFINYQGKQLNAARRLRVPKVRDRIEAVRFAKDAFGFEASDAIAAGVAARILIFGRLVEEDDKCRLEDEIEVPVDVLIDQLEYGEFVLLSSLMGKSRSSSASRSDTSDQPSKS